MRKPSTRDWSDLDTTSAIIGELAAPPASISYLAQAEAIVHDVATAAYACPAHMCDSLEETRYHAVVLPLGVTYWRAAFTRCSEHGVIGTGQAATELEAGTLPVAAAEVITSPAQTAGAYVYMDMTGTANPVALLKHQRTGGQIDDAPAATTDRQVPASALLRPQVVRYSISATAGHSAFISGRTVDLETL
jgi:hypothetical protein